MQSLFRILEDTGRIVAGIRRVDAPLPMAVDRALERVEVAVARALDSSPDGQTVAHAEEMVALDAVCDLNEASRHAPAPIRQELVPLVEDWIGHAAAVGLELQRR